MNLASLLVGLLLLAIAASCRSWSKECKKRSKGVSLNYASKVFVWMSDPSTQIAEKSWVEVTIDIKYTHSESTYRDSGFTEVSKRFVIEPSDAMEDYKNKKYRDENDHELDPLDAYKKIQSRLDQARNWDKSSDRWGWAFSGFAVVGGFCVFWGLMGRSL